MRKIDERDQVTITANFTYEVYRSPSSDWCCAKFRDCETSKEFHAIGNSLPNKKTIPYLLTGRWGINKKTGQKQFEVAYVDIAKVSEKDGVIAELAGSVNVQRLQNHPLHLTADDFSSLYRAILEG